MQTRAQVEEWLRDTYPDEDFLLADGLDSAFLGVAIAAPNQLPVAAYDFATVIEILMERDGMDHGEALEFFDVNISGAFVGKRTPVFLERC